MRALRDAYYALFYFWFRLDLLTKRREDKALKALGAVTVVQVWLLLGAYWWVELLFGVPSPPVAAFVGSILALFVGNHLVLRRLGWVEFEGRFALYPRWKRWACTAAAGFASAAALALLLGAAIVARSGP